jgi:hypothetical protein
MVHRGIDQLQARGTTVEVRVNGVDLARHQAAFTEGEHLFLTQARPRILPGDRQLAETSVGVERRFGPRTQSFVFNSHGSRAPTAPTTARTSRNGHARSNDAKGIDTPNHSKRYATHGIGVSP